MRIDYIDSCIFLGFVLNNNQNCKDYINTVGYMNRNKGIISHFVVSEIFITLITKLEDKNQKFEKIEKSKAFYHIDNIISKMLKDNVLIINKLKTRVIDELLLNEIMNVDNKLTEDDIFHIIEAIKDKCDFFVTTDQEIIKNSRLREHLSIKYNLKIKELKL